MRKNDLFIAVAIIGLLLLVITFNFKREQEECQCKGYIVYTIMPEDTIWSIASSMGGNTEKIVYTIRQDNGIENVGMLKVGQKILLRKEY